MKAFKAFIKPFEVPQKSVKKKFKLFFSRQPRSGREGLTGYLIQKIRVRPYFL